MKRLHIAIALLFATALFTLCGAWQVKHVTNQLFEGLQSIDSSAEKGLYETALAKVDSLAAQYRRQEHILAFYIPRTQTAAIAMNLASLRGFLCEEYMPDLRTELDRAYSQVYAVRHLFFSVF